MSELFLLFWAVVATIFAVYYNHVAKQFLTGLNHAKFALFMVAEGKVKITKSNGEVHIKVIDDEGV
jgi:hypothetical protein